MKWRRKCGAKATVVVRTYVYTEAALVSSTETPVCAEHQAHLATYSCAFEVEDSSPQRTETEEERL